MYILTNPSQYSSFIYRRLRMLLKRKNVNLTDKIRFTSFEYHFRKRKCISKRIHLCISWHVIRRMIRVKFDRQVSFYGFSMLYKKITHLRNQVQCTHFTQHKFDTYFYYTKETNLQVKFNVFIRFTAPGSMYKFRMLYVCGSRKIGIISFRNIKIVLLIYVAVTNGPAF